MRLCWNCGAEQRWACVRCGSWERRPNGKGCAECHRRYAREMTVAKRAANDFEITPAMRRYLAAFGRVVAGQVTGEQARTRESFEPP